MSREAYRWRKKLICLGLACLMFLSGSLAACGRQTEQSAYHIEYLNKDKNRLVEEPYEPSATDTDGMIKEFLAKLSSDSDNVDYRKPIPNDVEITNYSLDGVLLTLHFDEDYSKMSAVDEVLCRAAVVRTMTQIDGVDCVAFYIGDAPLTDAKGNLVGTMNQDSFIENPGEQINAIQTTTLTLYFSNRDGDALVKETQTVHYSSNISIEKLVIEHLLEQPKNAKGKSAIPSGTKLLSVTTVDGVCYVNFDAGFTNQDYEIQEPIVIYSIVNSLSELSTVSKVQISVNGSTKGVYRDSYKLDKIYDRNLDYLEERQKGEKAKSE